MPAIDFRLPACFGQPDPGEWLSPRMILAYLGGCGVQISAEHLDRILADARRLGVIESERRLEYAPTRQSWASFRAYRLTRNGWMLWRFGRPAGRAFRCFAAPGHGPAPA